MLAYHTTNHTWTDIFKNDTVRYQQKGFGLIIATIIALAYIYITPQVFRLFWPCLLNNVSNGIIFFTFAFGTHSVTYIISNLVMWMIYKIKLPFFERYRIYDKPRPWESSPEAWNQIVKKTLKRVSLYHFLVIPSLTLIGLLTGVKVKVDMESYPETLEIITQIIFFMLCEDFVFYWGHRLLHHPLLYRKIHKTHHEYNITVSFASEYCHPLEFLISSIVSVLF